MLLWFFVCYRLRAGRNVWKRDTRKWNSKLFFASGIDAPRHEHPAVMTVEESLRLVPKLPGAKTKNLFLRDKKGARHFLVTVPHDRAVDLDAVLQRRHVPVRL